MSTGIGRPAQREDENKSEILTALGLSLDVQIVILLHPIQELLTAF
jgi:hypothetical protein